jgi:hypothetical protein
MNEQQTYHTSMECLVGNASGLRSLVPIVLSAKCSCELQHEIQTPSFLKCDDDIAELSKLPAKRGVLQILESSAAMRDKGGNASKAPRQSRYAVLYEENVC